MKNKKLMMNTRVIYIEKLKIRYKYIKITQKYNMPNKEIKQSKGEGNVL